MLDRLSRADELTPSSHDLAGALRRVEVARREVMSPAEALIEALHPWVAFLIMPLFALANAGVSLKGASLEGGGAAVALGAAAGLVVGKPLGVLVASGVALRTGLATLPRGLTARHLVVLGAVAGVGFTMSIFIAQLAFVDRATLGAVKLGVLAASAVAAALGLGLGRWLLRVEERTDVAPTTDHAERSTEM